MEFSAQQIASVLGGTVEGDPEVKVNNFSKIEKPALFKTEDSFTR